MKKWCKILELEKYDVLIERLVTKEDGEHVKITVRFPDGQFIKTACMGDGEGAEKMAIELFDTYKEADALRFVEELDKLVEVNGKEEDGNKED